MISADPFPIANHLWQSTLFAAAAWLLAMALQRNRAAVRYWVWLAASVKFLIPISLLVNLGGWLDWRSVPVLAQPEISILKTVGRPFAVPGASLPTAPVSHVLFPLPAVLFFLWGCGLAVSALFWIRHYRRVHAIVRAAAPLDLALPIRTVASRSRMEPGVFGIRRPVLLLPEGITARLTPAQLDAVLAHELCHVWRRDNLTGAIHLLAETLFWFHPLIWWIGAQLVRERERACDEEVIGMAADPREYAEGILNVCRLCLESAPCVAGVTGADLKRRIAEITGGRIAQNLSHAKRALLASAAAGAIAGPVAIGLLHAAAVRAPDPALPRPAESSLQASPARDGWSSVRYILTVSKGGSRLKRVAPGEPAAASPEMFRDTRAVPEQTIASLAEGLFGRRVTMPQFVQALSRELRATVEDRTGLAGDFDIDLVFSTTLPAEDDAAGISIFTAIQEQLGLKLERTPAPLDSTVVEPVHKAPSGK